MYARALAAGLAGLLAIGALGACGKSKEEKAQNQVCDARADIQTQINTLQKLPVASSSLPQAQDSLNSILQDLKLMADVQSDLKGSRKEQIQTANKTFTEEIKSAAKVGYQAVVGDLACDTGSMEALGLDEYDYWSGATLYFATEKDARTFTTAYTAKAGAPKGVVKVKVGCLD